MPYTNAVFYIDYENGNDAARTALTTVIASNPSGTITRMTKAGHGLVTGAVVGCVGFTTWLNSNWKITVVDADNFDLDGAVWQATADTNGSVSPFGGSSKADAWKTVVNGATSPRHQAGDEIRHMASSYPTLLGSAVWTQYSKDVTLPAAVTATISDCETAWTGSANVTASASTTQFKQGTRSAAFVMAAGFTTGKIGYTAVGPLDLSAFQQVSFWFRTTPSYTAGMLELRLCSDATGDVPVHTIAIPANSFANNWAPFTVDTGAALGTSIASVALYAATDPGSLTLWIDNIIACKASASADALTLNTMIGKACAALSWAAATTYASGDERKPSPTMRNGFRYKVTAQSGPSGSSEPAWPELLGESVADGGVTWTCEGLEDTWYAIQSISGTTVKIDSGVNTLGNAGRGYAGASETVATYCQRPILITPGTTAIDFTRSGTLGAPIRYSGGWDRVSMQAQVWETWFSARGGGGVAMDFNSETYLELDNFGFSQVNNGIGNVTDVGAVVEVTDCHFSNCTTTGISSGNGNAFTMLRGVHLSHGGSAGALLNSVNAMMERVSINSNVTTGLSTVASVMASNAMVDTVDVLNNGTFGLSNVGLSELTLNRLTMRGNGTAGINQGGGVIKLNNTVIDDAVEVTGLTTYNDIYIVSHQHDRTADNHLLVTDGGMIVSATDQRHTASGISWKFRPTAATRTANYPLRLELAKIACEAGEPLTLQIWTRRDNTNIKGRLKVAGGQLAGIASDVTVSCEAAINTWELSAPLTVTPTESGVLEVVFEAWDGVGTTNSLWVDDLVID